MEKQKSVGGVWKKMTKKSQEMLSISVEINGVKHKFVAFENNFKNTDSHPDFKIYESKPLQENSWSDMPSPGF